MGLKILVAMKKIPVFNMRMGLLYSLPGPEPCSLGRTCWWGTALLGPGQPAYPTTGREFGEMQGLESAQNMPVWNQKKVTQ